MRADFPVLAHEVHDDVDVVVAGAGAAVADRHPPARRLMPGGLKTEPAHRLLGHLGPLCVGQVAVRPGLGGERQVPAGAVGHLRAEQHCREVHSRRQLLQFGLGRPQARLHPERRRGRYHMRVLVLVVPPRAEQVAHRARGLLAPRHLRDHASAPSCLTPPPPPGGPLHGR